MQFHFYDDVELETAPAVDDLHTSTGTCTTTLSGAALSKRIFKRMKKIHTE